MAVVVAIVVIVNGKCSLLLPLKNNTQLTKKETKKK